MQEKHANKTDNEGELKTKRKWSEDSLSARIEGARLEVCFITQASSYSCFWICLNSW